MKLKFRGFSMGLFCVLLLTSSAQATFPDVEEYSEYAEAIECVSELSIMVGDSEGNFNPNRTVTRAQMAAIVCRLLGYTEDLTTSNKFSDVPTSYWANTYISKVAELGIVSGYNNGAFRPNNTVTYEQAVAMVIRAVGGEQEAQDMGGYPDGYLNLANENHLLNGVFSEKGEPLSRADIAAIIYNCVG